MRLKKLYSEGIHNLYSSPDIIKKIKSRRMRWARNVARTGEVHTIFLIGKPEEKRILGRPRYR
jgi:hypothetical protein